jgi:hypothetical protein
MQTEQGGQVATVTQRGARLFTAGTFALLVVAGLHTLGHFSTRAPDPMGGSVLEQMRQYRVDVGLGQQPSLMDIQQSLSLTMTILLVGVGLINLSMVALAGDVRGVLRRLTMLNLLIVGSLVILYGWYRITPPFVTLFAVELLFVASLLVQRAADTIEVRRQEVSSPST